MKRSAAVVPVGLVAVLGVAAGLAFHRVLGTRPLLFDVVVASVLPALLTLVWSVGERRRSLALALAGDVVCWLFAVSATALRDGAVAGFVPTFATLRSVGGAVTDSWWRMLTVVGPSSSDPRTLAAVQTVVWFGCVAGCEIAVRRGMALGAGAPSALVLCGGLAFSAGTPGSDAGSAGLFVFCAGLLVVLRPGSRPLRTSLAGTAVVVVVAVVAAGVGPRLWFAHSAKPFDLRRFVTPAAATLETVSPLDSIAGWLQHPGTVLFRAALPPDQRPGLWRLAVLDSFDGTDWSASGRLEETGGRIPPPPDVGPVLDVRVEQTITVAALGGDWVPALGVPTQATGLGVAVDVDTATLVADRGLIAGQRFDLLSQPMDSAPLADPRDARLAADPADLALPPNPPDVLGTTAQLATAGATFPAQQAVLLADYLRKTESYDPAAPPGHAYGHLAYFLSTSHRGTSEQFACSYAVMARELGLPTRVVVGFSGGDRQPDGTWAVRAGDVLAWPEVRFAGIGWVPFYPTPASGPSSPSSPTDVAAAKLVAAGESADRAASDREIGDAAPVPASAGPATQAAPPARSRPDVPWWAAVASGVVLVLIVVFCYGAAMPVWRRSRRRRAVDPGERVIGAWREALDDMRVLSFSPDGRRTAPDTAASAARHAAGHAGAELAPLLVPLARLADRAAFAAVPASAEHAEAAWRLEQQIRSLTRKAAARGARIRSRFRWR